MRRFAEIMRRKLDETAAAARTDIPAGNIRDQLIAGSAGPLPPGGNTGSGYTPGDTSVTTGKIANDAVTYAKMQNVSAASKLLGRGDSGSGDPQEITLGSGLSMTGTTLSSSGGGSGLVIEEVDGSPTNTATKLKLPNGTLSYSGSEATYTPAASGYTKGARVYNSAALTIPNNTGQVLTFNSERWDTDGIHSTVSNTSRLTCQTAGRYLISAALSFTGNTAGIRAISIKINGTTSVADQTFKPINDTTTHDTWTISTIYSLSVGDYAEVEVYHNTGADLDIRAVGNISPEFMMEKIGE